MKVPLSNKNVFNIKSPKNNSAIKDLVKHTPVKHVDVKKKVSNHFVKAFQTSRAGSIILPDIKDPINLSVPMSPKKLIMDFGAATAMGSPQETQTTSQK